MTAGSEAVEPLRVLMLEDSEADAQLAIHALRQLDSGASVDVAATRREFTALLAGHSYDIVLADYGLPNWTGMEALRELRHLGFDTPLIVVTGELGDERAVECVKGGAVDYILKANLARLPLAAKRAVEEKRARDKSAFAQRSMEHAQQQLHEREERFGQLADNIDEVFFVMDARHSETLYINRAYERIWGRSCQSLYDNAQSFMEPVPAGDRERLLEYMARVAAGEQPGKLEYRVIQPDGSVRWLLAHAVPIRNEDGDVYRIAGVALDITESREAQLALEESSDRFRKLTEASFEERRALEDQFRQAQKMEAVGRLAGGVAHDFNNLLTVILSYTDLLIEGVSPSDPRADDLGEIRRAAVTAGSLTRQLLAFSRQQVIEPRLLDLNDVVANSEKMLRRLIGEDIEVNATLSSTPLTVMIDPGQLEQVLMNLSVNARDAMPTGGKLTLETASVVLDAEYARDHWPAHPGRFAMLAVSDTGCGMDEQVRSHIFEPFFTTKGVGKGTGLGLATVYGIVKQSNGFIWVYSELDRGTSFKIYFPLLDREPELYESKVQSDAPPFGTETVLLAEDAAAVRGAARQILERYGYSVVEAPNGTVALSIAERAGTIDLLLTDVVMPEMSGRELAEQFAKLKPDAKVLFMSGYTDDAVIRHGVLRPGTAYLQKPFSPDALARKVREVLDARVAETR